MDRDIVRVRGEYSPDDSGISGSMMYQGGAGMAGLLAQIATHAAINNSQRSNKLAQAQEQANKILLPLNDVIEQLSLPDLLDSNTGEYQLADSLAPRVVNSRPIFFVAPEFAYISVKNIVWLEQAGKARTRGKPSYDYRNLIEVRSRLYDEAEQERLSSGKGVEFFKDELRNLFHESLILASREVKGRYKHNSDVMATYKLVSKQKNQYIRGKKIDLLHDKLVLKNLRSWLIAIPEDYLPGQTKMFVN
ncbi:hypothetical protein [Thalassomonas haliotis]|uniref:Uncharacterized protein n=1 Tax=Thalassomonas haliotis TaxID=485448 RepID=A0ABY7VIV2_9GAMM|nr:hypothetical protein [Thalassomonas haliotis]WDE12863.1 hypothetical protein H3N35_05205 [Thalassomonas haliotis]